MKDEPKKPRPKPSISKEQIFDAAFVMAGKLLELAKSKKHSIAINHPDIFVSIIAEQIIRENYLNSASKPAILDTLTFNPSADKNRLNKKTQDLINGLFTVSKKQNFTLSLLVDRISEEHAAVEWKANPLAEEREANVIKQATPIATVTTLRSSRPPLLTGKAKSLPLLGGPGADEGLIALRDARTSILSYWEGVKAEILGETDHPVAALSRKQLLNYAIRQESRNLLAEATTDRHLATTGLKEQSIFLFINQEQIRDDIYANPALGDYLIKKYEPLVKTLVYLPESESEPIIRYGETNADEREVFERMQTRLQQIEPPPFKVQPDEPFADAARKYIVSYWEKSKAAIKAKLGGETADIDEGKWLRNYQAEALIVQYPLKGPNRS